MNSIHRIGLTIAGVAGALTMVGALAVQGYANDVAAAQATVAPQAAGTQAPTDPTTDPTALDPETIYINPAPAPSIITVTITPPPSKTRRQPKPPVVHIIVPSSGGDDGGEGGGD
jgi:hypothetical protein